MNNHKHIDSADSEKSPLLTKCSSQGNVKPSSKSIGRLVIQFICGITVEPAFFLLGVYVGMDLVSLPNLWVDKVCDSLYSQKLCEDLDSGNYPNEQDNVQEIVNKYQSTYSRWIEYFPAVFTVLILGAWSDAKDRRLPVCLPFVGLIFKSAGIVINSYFWYFPPTYLLLASIPIGFTGGMMAVVMGCSSYLSAITDINSRTIRISSLYLLMMVSLPLGKAVTAILFKHFGYIGVFSSQGILAVCALIYSLLRLEKNPDISGEEATALTNQRTIWQILSPIQMKKTLSIPFKKREKGIQTQLLGQIFIIAGLLFDMGTSTFHYLYARKMFGWDFYTFTTWSELSTPLAGIGTIFVMPLLSYRYHVEDSILGLMGSFSYMFNNIIMATAPEGWVLYVALVAAMLSGMCFVASRGALSKLVPKEELGAIFAVVALGECIMPLLNGPLYTVVYNATLEVYPGTIYAFTAVMCAFLSFVYTWLLARPDRPLYNAPT